MSDSPRAVAPDAVALIVDCEVSSQAVYEQRWQRPNWPGGESGVTIGIGYDLGQHGPLQFRADWADALPSPSIERLAQCCGVRGSQAHVMAAALHDVTVPWQAAESVFLDRVLPAYAVRTQAALPDTAELPDDCFGALVSLVFNRGASFAMAGGRYAEMRGIKWAMASGAFAAIPDLIRDMKRLWPEPGEAGLVARREAEATLFERGLLNLQPISEKTS